MQMNQTQPSATISGHELLTAAGTRSLVSSTLSKLSLGLCFQVLCGTYILNIIYYCYFHRLANVPGPWLAQFSESWRNYRYFRGTWMDDVISLHEQYGDVVRIAPNEVSFVDRGALKALYGHGKPSQKSDWYRTWQNPAMSRVFFAITDRQVHKQLRSRVSAVYSMSSILAMEGSIQDVANASWMKLRDLVQRNEPVQLERWVNYFCFDVVGQLAMGGPLGMLEQEKDVHGLIHSIHDGNYLMANMGNIPMQMAWFNNSTVQWIVKTFGGEQLNAFDKFLEWLGARVDERIKSKQDVKHNDMLDYFVRMKDHGGGEVKRLDVIGEGAQVLGAGADTTAIAILATIGALLLHPEEKAKVAAEVDQAYKSLANNASEISFKEAEKLPLLSAVIKESMRLHPSVTYQLPRVPPPTGLQIGPYTFDSRTVCGISAVTMNRSKEIFGTDADKWNPHRWIPTSEGDIDRISGMTQDLTTFGMGSRGCIGRNMALLEVYKYVAQFLRHFDAELVNKSQPWTTKSQWLGFQADFWVRLTEREIGQ